MHACIQDACIKMHASCMHAIKHHQDVHKIQYAGWRSLSSTKHRGGKHHQHYCPSSFGCATWLMCSPSPHTHISQQAGSKYTHKGSLGWGRGRDSPKRVHRTRTHSLPQDGAAGRSVLIFLFAITLAGFFGPPPWHGLKNHKISRNGAPRTRPP